MTNQVDLFKALSNEVRLDILRWLKDPETHFNKPTAHLATNLSDKGGICVGDIQEKANLSQSTVSQYLAMLQKSDCSNPNVTANGRITGEMKKNPGARSVPQRRTFDPFSSPYISTFPDI